MGGFFGAISRRDCVLDLFFGTDYHSHLGTRRGGMTVRVREAGQYYFEYATFDELRALAKEGIR